MKLTTLALCAASLLATATASAQTPSRQAMIDVLSGWEAEPSVATVRSWGERAPEALISVAESAEVDTHARVRAVHALRAFPGSERARSWLRSVAARRPVELFFLRSALDALIEGFDEVEPVAARLSDPDPAVRDGAAWALSRSPSARARAAAEQRLAVEADENVRRTLSTVVRAPRGGVSSR